jgi:hypothetical protein
MAEVDRLSNSGLYPALPIADKRSRKDGSGGRPPPEKNPLPAKPPMPATPKAGGAEEKEPPPSKHKIDEYA